MSKALTTEDFKSDGYRLYGDRFDYSLSEYKNAKTKIKIFCRKHEIMFEQTREKHMRGVGCKQCATEAATATNLRKYGVEHTFQSENNKTKAKSTSLRKYGVAHPIASKEIRDKAKTTLLKRYGVDNPFASKEIMIHSRRKHIDLYGVENNTQKHMCEILPLIQDAEWLFDQYITLGKSAVYIAHELGVSDVTICNYLHKHEIAIRYNVGYSIGCIRWLDTLISNENIIIQHALNGGEYCIPNTKYKVDGYCKETNTVYEFHGDIYHGNPDVFAPEEYCHPFKDISAGVLYKKTIEREDHIKSLGYNLIVMWENDFRKIYK